jgi:hypothetical protein
MAETSKILHPRYIVDESGKRVSVVLSLEEYDELMDDMADLAAIAERRNEDTVEHVELVKQLTAEGLLSPLPG